MISYECIEWTGSVSPEGYGKFAGRYIHRVLADAFYGPIKDGFVVDHKCRNRKCINPSHFEIVSFQENVLRGLQGRLKTHCPHGHEYSGLNVGWQKSKGTLSGRARLCLTCRRSGDRKRKPSLAVPKGEPTSD